MQMGLKIFATHSRYRDSITDKRRQPRIARVLNNEEEPELSDENCLEATLLRPMTTDVPKKKSGVVPLLTNEEQSGYLGGTR